MVQQLATNTFTTAKWIVSATASDGTHTTIQSAINSASSGDTIFIRPGTYTENLTLKAGVNLTAFQCDSIGGQVIIKGKASFTGTGDVVCSGIFFLTNADFCISITGTNASVINLMNCGISCADHTGIEFTTTSSSAVITIIYSTMNLGTTGIALYSMTSPGTINIQWSQCNNTGSSTTASNNSAGTVDTFYCNFNIPFSTSSTGKIGMTETFVDTHAINTTCVTTAGTATHTLQHCSYAAGTASALSAGVGTTINTNAIILDSSNATVVTGAGTVAISILEQGGSPGAVNPSVLTGEVSNTGPLRSMSISFDNGNTLLSTYATNTFTPTITFGGGSTGITYTTQTGQYWQIGAVVHVSMQIVLSNKGSSTGIAEIRGLPVTTRAASVAVLPCLTGNIAGGGTAVFPVFLAPDASGTKGVVYLSNTAAGVTALADTNFTNTSFIDCTGFYFSA